MSIIVFFVLACSCSSGNPWFFKIKFFFLLFGSKRESLCSTFNSKCDTKTECNCNLYASAHAGGGVGCLVVYFVFLFAFRLLKNTLGVENNHTQIQRHSDDVHNLKSKRTTLLFSTKRKNILKRMRGRRLFIGLEITVNCFSYTFFYIFFWYF